MIGDELISGVKVREELARHGHKTSLPSFYTMMSRLENMNYIEGQYQLLDFNGGKVKERRYRITETGKSAWAKTQEFFVRLAERPGRLASEW